MWRCKLKQKSLRATILCALIWFGADLVFACGPDFPNTLVDGGDKAVLSAPVVNFTRELERMKLSAPAFVANPATNSYMRQTLETDLMDLNAALRKAKVSVKQKESILEDYRAEREKIQQYK